MSRIFNLEQIKAVIDKATLVQSQEEGFVAYSEGRVVVPPVGYLGFTESSGDCHIKYGYIKGDDYFVVKIATGFYQNPEIGLPVGNGMMAILSQKTGALEALLLDEGYLTDLRTAAAGAIAAKYLAPKKVTRIGIVGTGVQARLQLEMLKTVTNCREATVWGRDSAKVANYVSEMAQYGFDIKGVSSVDELAGTCDLIITTTASREALLFADHVHPGTHITAVGADADGKQELDPEIFRKADVRVVDSKSQCLNHGDTCHAVKPGFVNPDDLVELGSVVKDSTIGRTSDNQITVVDLTGVAVQDIQIAKLVYNNLEKKHRSASSDI